jgi:hypothetical protein
MARRFVVEGEAGTAVADLDEATLVPDPPHRGLGRRRGHGDRGVGRLERVARQHVLEVHEQELLVLLLVVEAEDNAAGGFGGGRGGFEEAR